MSKKNKKVDKSKYPLIYRVFRPLYFVFTGIFRPRIIGKENIPKKGRVVIAGNHMFVLDPILVAISTWRCVHFLGKYEIFKYKFTNWLFTSAGVIPVHRQRKDHNALVSAEEYLEADQAVALFPETTIIKPEGVQLLPFKIGAVKMAYDTKTPIVPFTINGSYIPFNGRLEIIFHEPYYIPDGADLAVENDKLRERVQSKLTPHKGKYPF